MLLNKPNEAIESIQQKNPVLNKQGQDFLEILGLNLQH
ncbi:hypothetical protein DOT_4466 [Desulfosporosinus sp. OT]|nr:hypothetical protein DOT_4466 [Desulfosporosinus sp. OT]